MLFIHQLFHSKLTPLSPSQGRTVSQVVWSGLFSSTGEEGKVDVIHEEGGGGKKKMIKNQTTIFTVRLGGGGCPAGPTQSRSPPPPGGSLTLKSRCVCFDGLKKAPEGATAWARLLDEGEGIPVETGWAVRLEGMGHDKDPHSHPHLHPHTDPDQTPTEHVFPRACLRETCAVAAAWARPSG